MTSVGRRSGFQLAVFALIVVLLVLAGLVAAVVLHKPNHGGKASMLPPNISEEAPLTKSGSIEINFYLDITESMRGYLSQPEGRKNYFNEILDKALGILKEGWTDARVHFWGFGDEKPVPVELRNFLGKPDAFKGRHTLIDKAIQDEPPAPKPPPPTPLPRLKIILTDLFQEGNDLDRLGVFLSDYLKDPTHAVGILGLRSPFDGAIDDLPEDQKLPKGAADSLPFYLVITGPIADVNQAMAELSRLLDLDKLPKDQKIALVFGRRQVVQLNQKLVVSPAHPNKPGYTLEDDRVKGSAELGIPYLAGVRGDVELVASDFPSAALKKLGSHIKLAEKPVITASVWSGKEWTDAPEQASAVTVVPETGSIKVNHAKLLRRSVYLFEIDFAAEPTDFGDLSPWYIELSDVPRIMRNKAFDQVSGGSRPGRTPDLRHFLQTLSSKMFLQSSIPLARYYFYVQSQ
jgi:hypothetical protein